MEEDSHELMKYSTQIAEMAKKNGIEFHLRKKLNEDDYKYLMKNKYDFGFCCGWRTMIDADRVAKNFKIGILAAHDSLLPKYRGFAPLNWAIINGEKKTGVTLFVINNKEVDSGEIYDRRVVSIKPEENAIDVYKKVCEATINLCLDFINHFNKKKLQFKKQNEKKATYTCKRIPADGRIDWNKSSKEIHNLIRGCSNPFPGAFCYKDDIKYIIDKSEIGESDQKKYVGRIPGRVIKIDRLGLEILCGKGSLKILSWKKDGEKDFICASQEVRKISTTLS